jgi:hypothetical protein
MKLRLSIGLASNPRTWPVLDGQVTADGIELVPSVVHPSIMSLILILVVFAVLSNSALLAADRKLHRRPA